MKYLLAIGLLAFTWTANAADPPAAPDFTGHYELAKSSKSSFTLDVNQKGKGAIAAFAAATPDGSGAAPDGDGQGQLNDKGEMVFQWTDSFDNAGTAVLRREGELFHFVMTTTKVEESRALAFYGDVALVRAPAKPRAGTNGH